MKEENLQKIVEQNLMSLFRLKLIKSEFRLGSQRSGDRRSSPRPDTLAFDEEKKCFVVIEYKIDDADRTFRQLSTYAGAKDSPKSKMAMITKYYEKQKEKNSGLAPLNPAEICWDSYYCIYISLNITDDLVENSVSLRRGNDIRMYEIHLFARTVVLCRADADDFSIDDGLDDEPSDPDPGGPGPTPDSVPILSLSEKTTATHKPEALVPPDGKPIDVKAGWRAVLREIACWLADEGHIKHKSQSKLLLAKPLSRMSSQVELSNGLYVNLDLRSVNILKHAKKLLADIGYKPSCFTITLNNSSKNTAGSGQSTQPPDFIPILDLKSDITDKRNPAVLQFPDGASIAELNGWSTVLAKVASWLSEKGHIREQSQSSTLRAVIHRKPSHRPVHLANGLYINLNEPAGRVLANMQKLLKDVGYEPRNFRIGLKNKIR